MNAKKIVCGIATVEYRVNGLEQTVNSIINQVDKLIVYQNGYKETFDFLNNDKIQVISSLDTGVDMGDAGKFYKVDDFSNEYYFSIDDDLIYPSNYIEHTISELNKNNDSVIITYHGKVLKENAESFYKDLILAIHYKKKNENDTFVDLGGTGVMAFSTEKFKLKFDIFKRANIADIWVGIESKKQNIPILCLKHDENWITDRILSNKTNIYNSYKNQTNFNIDLIKNFKK